MKLTSAVLLNNTALEIFGSSGQHIVVIKNFSVATSSRVGNLSTLLCGGAGSFSTLVFGEVCTRSSETLSSVKVSCDLGSHGQREESDS